MRAWTFLYLQDMRITAPPSFNFKNTILSHGWCELLPFRIDEDRFELSYVLDPGTGVNPIDILLREAAGKIEIDVAGSKPDGGEAQLGRNSAAHVLRLDEDLNGFYKVTSEEAGLEWIAKRGAGRLLRSPTVFEDLVKTICTTNCSWALTKSMVGNLVEKLGKPSAAGGSSFPTPGAMASVDELFYRDEIRAGYRGPYLAELARRVDSGDLDPESWLASTLPTNELKKEILGVKGAGNYAAENLLKLLGRYDGLALDSFLRSEFYKKHRAGTACSDKEIEAHYERFGCWRGLVIWCEMSKRWLV